jgi:hypothetical protein
MPSIATASQGGITFWLVIIDKYTKYGWHLFLKHRRDLTYMMVRCFFSNLQREFDVKLHDSTCDNAYDNDKFMEELDKYDSVFLLNLKYTRV